MRGIRDEKRIPQERRIPQQLTRFGLLRVPEEKELKDAITSLRVEMPKLEEAPGSLITGGRVAYPWLRKRKRVKPALDQVWVFAEKRELAQNVPHDVFIPLTEAVKTTRARGAVRVKLVINDKLVPRKPDKLPKKAVVIADANPTGRFLAESVANYLMERGVEVEFTIASTPKTVRQTLAEYRPPDPSGYDPQARFEILRRAFDAGYTRIGKYIDKLIDDLGLYPKERAVEKLLNRAISENPELKEVADLIEKGELEKAVELLEEHAGEPGYETMKQAVEMKFVLAVRGRLGFTILALLDDMERENTLILDLGGGRELKVPVSGVGPDALQYTRVYLRVRPENPEVEDLTAPSHSECIRYLVSRGLSVDDAEDVMERLWLRGIISYPRNEGDAVLRNDVDDVLASLAELGVEQPKLPFKDRGDPGVYIVNAERAKDLVGVEREFVDWLAKRLSSPVTKARIEADIYVGRELVDHRYYEDTVEVASSIEGWFKPVDIEIGADGVSLEKLVARLQQLNIGTEATRSKVLGDLQRAGLITIGDKIRLTNNGRIVSAIVRLAFKNATDADTISEIFDKLRVAAEKNENVDEVIAEAWRTVFEKRSEFARRVYRMLIVNRRVSLTLPERIAVAIYLRGPMTLRDIRREIIGKRWRRDTPEILRASGYFEFTRGDRRDSIVVKLTKQGELVARTILAELPERENKVAERNANK